MDLIQNVILSQWLIILALAGVFMLLTRWALRIYEEVPGYALGWLIGVFFIIVRLAVGDADISADAPQYLNVGQVIISTIFGLIFGMAIIFGLRFGLARPQAVSIQVAIYTAGLIIMIFMVVIGTPITQKMIGIFGLAIGIATLFAMVLFPSPKRREQLNIKVQEATGANPPLQGQHPNGQGGGFPQNQAQNAPQSRLDQIRKKQNQKLNR